MTTTGIPPRVAVTRRMSKLAEGVKVSEATIEVSSNIMIEHTTITIQPGHVTKQNLNQRIQTAL
eukprot:maker-scaffold_30-snap-gene-1.4-mRNA-1 protein AED:0.45 eAED:0.46 QI:0/0/0/1/1/1/2/0/63